jgi:hypothetical protein
MGTPLYVRLKPYNPKMGCLVKRYIIGDFSFTTDSATDRPVWNIIDSDIVDSMQLHDLLQVETEPRSEYLFDIFDREEYLQVVKRDEDLRLAELGIITATTAIPAQNVPVIDRTSGRAMAVPAPELPPTPVIGVTSPAHSDAISMKDVRNDSDVNYSRPAEEEPAPKSRRRRKTRGNKG